MEKEAVAGFVSSVPHKFGLKKALRGQIQELIQEIGSGFWPPQKPFEKAA